MNKFLEFRKHDKQLYLSRKRGLTQVSVLLRLAVLHVNNSDYPKLCD